MAHNDRAPYELPADYQFISRRRMRPAGDYTLRIVDSQYSANQHGTGMVMRLELQVIEGHWTGLVMTIDMILEHADEQIQTAGQLEFARLRRVLGIHDPKETSELRFIPFRATIGQRQISAAHSAENYFAALHAPAEVPPPPPVVASVQKRQRDLQGRFQRVA